MRRLVTRTGSDDRAGAIAVDAMPSRGEATAGGSRTDRSAVGAPSGGASHGRRRWRAGLVTVVLLVVADMLVGIASAYIAQRVRLNRPPLTPQVSGRELSYRSLSALLAGAWPATIWVLGGYRRMLTLGDRTARVLRAGMAVLAGSAVLAFVGKVDLSRGYVLVGTAGVVVGSMAIRAVLAIVEATVALRLGGGDRLLLMGSTESIRSALTNLRDLGWRGMHVVGVLPVDDDEAGSDELLMANLGTSRAVASATVHRGHVSAACESTRANVVLVTSPGALPGGGLRTVVSELAGSDVSLYAVPESREISGPNSEVRALGGMLLLSVRDGSPSVGAALLKGALDRILALVLLVLTSPLLLVLAILVRRDSDGPALFRQLRVGRHGKTFRICKFRTMVADAEERLHRDGLHELYVANGYKLPAEIDPRITRLGAFLRESSLDELPQLLNVLRGDMSLVGPRPVREDELASYGDLSPAYLGVRPGITGYWQVNGRSDVGFPERAILDDYYFLHRSLRLDLRILLKTVVTVFQRRGAF